MKKKPSILLTGGAGYIGSHTFVALIDAGFSAIILDNFSNSKPAVLERMQHISGQADLPPSSRTNVMFVKSVTMENDGHEEEQI